MSGLAQNHEDEETGLQDTSLSSWAILGIGIPLRSFMW